MDWTQVWEAVRTGGLVGFLLVTLWTGLKRKWVFGWQHEECIQEKLEWKRLALRGTDLADDGVKVGKQILDVLRNQK
jgi:hypothetical protein